MSTTLKRILFVDDEPNVLEGLQNMLRKQRRSWEMVFAIGGEAALAELGKAPFDVIVSDMRMPGMDGATLLERVRERHPATARIVLSGHAEQEAAVRALQVAHRFLSKPCDADSLRLVIEQTVRLQALLSNDAVRQVIGRLDKLPSVPRTYQELVRATADPTVGITDIARIVEQDTAMSIKVLQIVNSAYFGLAQKMTSVSKAVVYIGVELLKGLTLVAHVFSTMTKPPVEGFSYDELQRCSLLTARLAKRLVKEPKLAEDAFTAGLVHDVGKLIVALSVPDDFKQIVSEAGNSELSFHAIEKKRLGMTHAELGAYLLGVWGLPIPVVEAVAFHHQSGLAVDGPFDVVAAVHVADALIDSACGGCKGLPAESQLDLPFLEKTGLAAQLPAWRRVAAEEFAKGEESR